MASEFAGLTIGAKFDPSSNASTKALFKKVGSAAPLTTSTGGPTASAARASATSANDADGPTNVIAGLAVPPPVASLSSFFRVGSRSKGDDGKEGGNQGGGADSDAPAHKPVKAQHRSTVKRHLAHQQVTSTAHDFVPLKHFSELVRPPHNVPPHLVDNLFARDHRFPTPVQSTAIPLLLQKRDLLACAPTGSGKTIAFLVPLFARLKEPSRDAGVRALVLAPTKELAMQLEREAFFLLKGNRWRLVQHGQTTKDKDLMVTTPLRAATLIREGLLDVSHVEYLVFDEGDKLWEHGSDNVDHVERLLKACTCQDKTVCLFSATLSERIEAVAKRVMNKPERLIVRGRAEASADVEHRLLFVGSEMGKITAMRNLLRDGVKPPVLLFVQTVERTKEVLDEIQGAGLKVAVLNAKMSTEARDEAVMQFRLGNIWVLITTELLARGVDFKGVGTVINFDLPLTVESYVHRTGRTGRAGRKGCAITFFTEGDKDRLPTIARVIERSGSTVDPWILEKLEEAKGRKLRQLERTVPQRAVVSTRKRIMIAEKRVDARYRAQERETGEDGRNNRRHRDKDDEEADDDDVDVPKTNKRAAKKDAPRTAKMAQKKRRQPAAEEAFEDDVSIGGDDDLEFGDSL